MPKVPKTVSGRQRGAGNGTRRSKTGTRAAAGAEKTAKADGKPAPTDGKAQAKPATKPAPRRKTTKTTPAKARRVAKSSNDKAAAVDFSRRPVDAAPAATATKSTVSQLSESEQGLLADLFAVIEEHDEKGHIDREAVEHAFVFACERHADQRRRSGESFIVHPIGVAKMCAGMQLDTSTLCAALLHDTVEHTAASMI